MCTPRQAAFHFEAVGAAISDSHPRPQVTDHTSVVKLVEKRFGVRCPNISPWRRAVFGDLLAAFDFSAPDYSWPQVRSNCAHRVVATGPSRPGLCRRAARSTVPFANSEWLRGGQLPDTSHNANNSKYECNNLPGPVIPAQQFMPVQVPVASHCDPRCARAADLPQPASWRLITRAVDRSYHAMWDHCCSLVQEAGTKPSRSLPYVFDISDRVAPDMVEVTISNRGAAGGVFYVYNLNNVSAAPKKYTVESTKMLSDVWPLRLSASRYNLSLHGPNGFVRKLGGSGTSAATASITYLARSKEVAVSVLGGTCAFQISDSAYGTVGGPWTVLPGGNVTIPVGQSGNWYDLSVSQSPAV